MNTNWAQERNSKFIALNCLQLPKQCRVQRKHKSVINRPLHIQPQTFLTPHLLTSNVEIQASGQASHPKIQSCLASLPNLLSEWLCTLSGHSVLWQQPHSQAGHWWLDIHKAFNRRKRLSKEYYIQTELYTAKEFTGNSEIQASCRCMKLFITVDQKFHISLNKEH